MFLKRLDLVGFKSFAPRTSTELLPGIVVVVGPNGSGKSNIADSVRWVLGEQSARAVRARKAEEIIFAGSGSRQPLGMAEVSLVLDNSDNSVPIEYGEIRVTRRLYRSGESEYLLNGARVRLRDITQLLLHAGLSPDSYTVIGQGSIDELILQRPDERRVAFESAADIRRHQLRLNDTRAKLSGAEANLVRVQDVIAELGPHVRRLKVQADRAARGEQVRRELHDLLVRSFRARLARARTERRAADAALAEAVARAQRAEAGTLAADEALRAIDGALARFDERLAVLRPRAEGFREQARATERALAVARERAAGLGQQVADAHAEAQRLGNERERLLAEEQTHLRAAPAPSTPGESSAGPVGPGGSSATPDGPAVEDPLTAVRSRLVALQAELRTVQSERQGRLVERDASERRIAHTEEQVARAEQTLHALQSAMAVEEARQTDRDARLQALEVRVEALQRDQAAAHARASDAHAALGERTEARRAAAAAVAAARTAQQTASQQADRLDGALTALGATVLHPRQSPPEATVSAGHSPEPNVDPSSAPSDPAANATPGHSAQSNASARDSSSAQTPDSPVSGANRASAEAAIDGVSQSVQAFAAWQGVLHDLPVVGVAGELAAQIQPIDGLMRAYLDRTIVLPDDESAREAHRRLQRTLGSSAPAWAVLSLEGTLLTPGGEQPLEAAGADQGSALADWRRQVHQLEADLQAAERARAAADADLARAQTESERAAQHEADARAQAGAATAHLDQVRRAERDAAAERHRLRTEHERGSQERARRPEERLRALAATETHRQALERARQDREERTTATRALDAHVAALTERVVQAQAAVAAEQAAHAQRQAEREARAAVHARIRAELTRTAQAQHAAAERARQLTEHASSLEMRERQLVDEADGIQAQLAPMLDELARAERERAAQISERRAVELRLAELRAAERLAGEAREQCHLEAQRATDAQARLDTEIAETAELEADAPGGAAWMEQLRLDLGQQTPDEAVDLDAMRRRITVLQRDLRALGGVAGSVVDEFTQLSERHDFLQRESDDLRAAMIDLRAAEAELESHMRERFSAVFEATQRAFQECFATLFGGGEAQLVLTMPDDLLRTGVDIVARPPGKKLQGLLSLSGGERALTMVALLFGLLRVNPTPFCVLDEVDAALDEANVQRFVNLLGEFARTIQFVVVTHNRATMDRADALYGVSMDAHGISRIFSIRPHAVAAPA